LFILKRKTGLIEFRPTPLSRLDRLPLRQLIRLIFASHRIGGYSKVASFEAAALEPRVNMSPLAELIQLPPLRVHL
jgi:hypothetical protein